MFAFFRKYYYYIKHRILQSHMIDTGLPKGQYCDKTGLIEFGLLEITEDFVSRDKEDAFALVDWEDSPEVQEAKSKIIQILYFKNIYKSELEKKISNETHLHFEKWPMIFEAVDSETHCGEVVMFGKDDPECKKSLNIIMNMEKELEEETQRILHMIVDIRQYLWS